jgi:3-(3-hydroxy-phenyl)propionate hydroxylase
MSVYSFSCQRMEKFRHGRVLFAGDAAHGVSPFGARGANSGVQDADNLGWKLHMVLNGQAPERLLDSYDAERVEAADENIRHSTRSTDFITPKSDVSKSFRNAVLALAREHPFARRLVNSGRLSTATTLVTSSLNTADVDDFAGTMVPGAACLDAPVELNGKPGWLLDCLGEEFTLLGFGVDAVVMADQMPVALRVVLVSSGAPLARALSRPPPEGEGVRGEGVIVEDVQGLVARRFDARPGTCYLIRPDQHVCARWRMLDPARVEAALRRATCND